MFFIGFEWYAEHLRVFFAFLAVFYVLMYIAGGGRLPWRIKLRDYLAYVLISVGVVELGSGLRSRKLARRDDSISSPDFARSGDLREVSGERLSNACPFPVRR